MSPAAAALCLGALRLLLLLKVPRPHPAQSEVRQAGGMLGCGGGLVVRHSSWLGVPWPLCQAAGPRAGPPA